MDASLFKRASAAAQGILRLTNPKLVIDGWFGTFTNSAYMMSSTDTKSEVNAVLSALHTSADELYNYSRTVKEEASTSPSGAASDRWISEPQASAIVARMCEKFGHSELTEVVKPFLLLESKHTIKDGITMLDTKSMNGSYYGLFQIGTGAWADATAYLKRKGYDLPPLTQAWSNPEHNIAAGVAYAILNVERMVKDRIPVSTATVYTAHNQGYGGLKSYLRTGSLMYPLQSSTALRLMAKGRTEARDSAFV